MFSFRKVTDTPNAEHLVLHALPWIMEAGNPYYDVLFGDAGSTLTYLQKWECRGSSEVSIRRVEFLMSDSEFARGFIALSGGDLRKARRADSVALLTSVAPQDRPALTLRLNNVSGLMAPVGDDEYYLSKLVWRNSSAETVGAHACRPLYRRGRASGTFALPIGLHADNEAAIPCYRSAGFEISRRSQSQDGALKYYSLSY